jgi:hypothetical protein
MRMKTIYYEEMPSLKFILTNLKEDTRSEVDNKYPKLYDGVKKLVEKANNELCLKYRDFYITFWYDYIDGWGIGEVKIGSKEEDNGFIRRYVGLKFGDLVDSLGYRLEQGFPPEF